jgi:SAM-dependent methyltransferase
MKTKQKQFENYWTSRKPNSLTTKWYIKYYISLIKIFPNLNKKFSVILTLPKNAKVLDVGCGTCSFLRMIHKFRPDLELYGVDIDSDGFNFAKDIPVKLKTSQGDKLPFKNNTFDFVSCQHVLEHVLNPLDFVQEFKRVSKKYILLVTPNHKNIWLWDNQNFYLDHSHLRPFTKCSFRLIAKQLNLKIYYLRHERFINLPWAILMILFPFFLIRRSISDWLANVLVKRAVVMICKK